jgi:hypothetical protein
MKTSTIAIALAPAAASAQWWGGAPECAQTCLSSAWSSASATAASATGGNGWWPQQSDYCADDKRSNVQDCLAKDCSATPTAVSSYSSLASSLCSAWASCTAAGSTGAQTFTYPGGPVTWGAPGGWSGAGGNGNGPRGGNFGGSGGFGGWGGDSSDSKVWSEWADAYSGSKTWTGGVVTVTGCVGNGSPWFAGPGGGWNNLGGFNGWVGWGKGWSWGSTVTQTVTYTTTLSDGKVSEFTGLATVAAAVSGDLTTSTTLGAATATSTSSDSAGARVGGSSEGGIVTGMMGVALGAVILVAGML